MFILGLRYFIAVMVHRLCEDERLNKISSNIGMGRKIICKIEFLRRKRHISNE